MYYKHNCNMCNIEFFCHASYLLDNKVYIRTCSGICDSLHNIKIGNCVCPKCAGNLKFPLCIKSFSEKEMIALDIALEL
jgi:hypothetical protein